MAKALIKVQNCFSWLVTDSDVVRNTIYAALRFRAKGYFHSRLYKQGIWDGYKDFFKLPSGRFLSGLLPEVEFALRHLKCPYKIQDERTKPEFRCTEITPDYLKIINPKKWAEVSKKIGSPLMLEDYQCDLPNRAIKDLRGTLQAQTSSGKSYMIMCILHALKEKTPTLICSGNVSPVDGIYEELKAWGIPNIGRLYAGKNEPNYITCACVDSIHKIAHVLPKIKCIISDEIHIKMMAKKALKMYGQLTGCGMRIAVSATPFKFDGKDKEHKYSVKGYYGAMFKTNSKSAVNGVLQTYKLQELGRLSYADCHFWPMTEPDLPHAIYQDAVTYGVAQNWRFHNIIKELVEKRCPGRTLILVERLEHGDALKSLIPDALWVQGKDNLETRRFVIEKLQISKGNCVGIATNGIFNAAVNVFVHNLINAGGVIASAEHQVKQMFGRGLRVAGDKEILTYHDFMWFLSEYLLDHSKHRVKILQGERHKVTVHSALDFLEGVNIKAA